jgi:outer membrane lipoprotein SlyB
MSRLSVARLSVARRARSITVAATALVSGLALAGCAAAPPADHPAAAAPPPEAPSPPPPPPITQVFVYPSGGQSAAQLDRDRYECHVWAVRQSGFDPSDLHLAPHQRVQVVAMPPAGTGTLAGAATGAIIGAAVAGPYDAGSGAAIGAVAGAMLGAASDATRQQEADVTQRRYDAHDAQIQARLEQQSNDYRRAIGACLEGRGYTIK